MLDEKGADNIIRILSITITIVFIILIILIYYNFNQYGSIVPWKVIYIKEKANYTSASFEDQILRLTIRNSLDTEVSGVIISLIDIDGNRCDKELLIPLGIDEAREVDISFQDCDIKEVKSVRYNLISPHIIKNNSYLVQQIRDNTRGGGGGGGGDNTATPLAVNEPIPEKTFIYLWSKPQDPSTDNFVMFNWLTKYNLNPSNSKLETDKMPEGNRIMFSWDIHELLDNDISDYCLDPVTSKKYPCIWWDNGVKNTSERFDKFFKEYNELGGKLDYFILDFEGGYTWSQGLPAGIKSTSPEWVAMWRSIYYDPRFKTEIEPLLGFPVSSFEDFEKVYNTSFPGAWLYQSKWNKMMMPRMISYINKAVYEPIKSYYPNVNFSNYAYSTKSDSYKLPYSNGSRGEYYGGFGGHVGTHQSPSLYVSQTFWYKDSPFKIFRHSIDMMRVSKLSSPAPSTPWISHKEYYDSKVNNSDLFQEHILHILLTGPDKLLAWNTAKYFDVDMTKPKPTGTELQTILTRINNNEQLISNCLKEFDSLAGYSDRRTLVTRLSDWKEDFVLSGMYANKNKVWRFTPDNETNPVLSNLIKSLDPLSIETEFYRITFPQGRIHTVPDSKCSNAGIWIIQPANAEDPIVSTRPNPCRTNQGSCNIPLNGLVGYWKLDKDYNDYSQTKNNGIPYGNIHLQEDTGSQGAAILDGQGDWIETPLNTEISKLKTNFTVLGWAKLNHNNQDCYSHIASDSRSDVLEANNAGFTLYAKYCDRPMFEINNGTTRIYVKTKVYIDSTKWNHLGGVVNDTTISLFINGFNEFSSYWNGLIKTDHNNPLILGAHGSKYILGLNGTLDEVMIYNRALSPSEIEAIYKYQESNFVEDVYNPRGPY